MKSLVVRGKKLSLDDATQFLDAPSMKVSLAPDVIRRLNKVRTFIEHVAEGSHPVYGVNTGLGSLAKKRIRRHEITFLQENIIVSHAVGVGEPFSIPLSRLIMLLRAHVLAQGYSGITVKTLERIVRFLNEGITPIIPSKGSVSASGDLAPLAHIALTLIGRGLVMHGGVQKSASATLRECRLKPLTLEAKEALALVNGTQATLAVLIAALHKAINLAKVADITGSLSVEGDLASRKPFDPRIAKLHPHPGHAATAKNIRRLISGSRIIASHHDCSRVQDPYSFRCIPQVHGAIKDALRFVRETVTYELESCTDNPLVFVREKEILSGGNFHAEPLAIAADLLSIALAELGSIAERRVAILVAPLEGEIPGSFLVSRSGLNSGLMMPHVTMSALVSENKSFAHPASIDSIPTSGGQEDHVSMGLIAARKALMIAENVESILAIELLAACQAIDRHREPRTPGKGTQAVYALVRKASPRIDEDREYRKDINACCQLVRSGSVVKAAEKAVGNLSL